MSSLNKMKIIVLLFSAVAVTLLWAEAEEKKYGVRTGIVYYSISGGGLFAPEVNLTVRGKGELHFKEYGAVEHYKESIDETVTGAFKYIESVEVDQKCEYGQRSKVNFNIKKIVEYQVPKVEKRETVTKGLVKKGQAVIAKQPCDIWQGEGVRKCIYKGVPLLLEYGMPGAKYRKKAITVTFDTNTTDDMFKLPDYPLHKFALLKTTRKDKSKKLPQTFSKRLWLLSNELQNELHEKGMEEANLTQSQKREWLEKLGEDIFNKQKKLLPKYLLNMQKTRICLVQAEEWISANECLENFVDFKVQLTKERYPNIELWKEEERLMVLKEFDANIAHYESKMKCVRSAMSITDLAACML